MRIVWDAANRAHLAKHGIAPWLAEKIIMAGLSSLKRTDLEFRYVIEATIGGKHYRLVFASSEDKASIYPITAFEVKKRKI
jgi:hypothetical protein